MSVHEHPTSGIATTRILHARDNEGLRGQILPWIWPLPRLDGVAPCILERTEALARDDVELGYPSRTRTPALVPVFAVHDGIITYAGKAADGRTVCIDHTAGWSTQYADLAHMLVRPTDRFRRRRKERVQTGDVIGHASRPVLRIRFTLSRWSDDGCVAVEPSTWMSAWSALPWFAEPVRTAVRAAV